MSYPFEGYRVIAARIRHALVQMNRFRLALVFFRIKYKWNNLYLMDLSRCIHCDQSLFFFRRSWLFAHKNLFILTFFYNRSWLFLMWQIMHAIFSYALCTYFVFFKCVNLFCENRLLTGWTRFSFSSRIKKCCDASIQLSAAECTTSWN